MHPPDLATQSSIACPLKPINGPRGKVCQEDPTDTLTEPCNANLKTVTLPPPLVLSRVSTSRDDYDNRAPPFPRASTASERHASPSLFRLRPDPVRLTHTHFTHLFGAIDRVTVRPAPRMNSKPPIDPTQLWEIHGKYYDLDPFLNKHPGGRRFLEHSRGLDCTALFESIHIHDKIPKASLRKFYVADKVDYAPEFDWDADGFYMTVKSRVREFLSEEAKRQGLSGRSLRRAHHGTRGFVFRLAMLWVLWAAVSVGAVAYGQWSCALLWGPLVFALGGYGHEAMHAGVFESVRANRWLAWLTLDSNGLSSYVFTATHVPLHHIYTNVEGLDPDIEVHYPLTRERENQKRHGFHALQQFYSWVVYFFTMPVLYVVDIVAVLSGVWFGPWGKLQRPYSSEMAVFFLCKVGAVATWYVLPYLIHPWPTALLLNLAMIGGAGLAVQTTFALSHQNELAMNLDHRHSKHPRDWGAQQLETTVDFQHGHWLPVTIFGGLGFQIEHHLFPTISYSRLGQIAPIVKRTCEEFGVPYFYYQTAAEAVVAHYRFLHRMGQPPAQPAIALRQPKSNAAQAGPLARARSGAVTRKRVQQSNRFRA